MGTEELGRDPVTPLLIAGKTIYAVVMPVSKGNVHSACHLCIGDLNGKVCTSLPYCQHDGKDWVYVHTEEEATGLAVHLKLTGTI